MKTSTSMLYISSSCSEKDKISEAVRELAELGFKNIELTGNTTYYDSIENDLVRLQKEYELDYLIHNYFPPQKKEFVINLASRKTDIKERTLSLVKEALRLARIFGKNLYTMHPGYIGEMLPELKDNFFISDGKTINSRENFYKTLELLSEELIRKNCKIGVENLGLKAEDNKFSFMCDNNDIEQFLAYFENNESMGILLDLGHLNIASQILQFDRDSFLNRVVDSYSEKIFAFHLSGNDGYIDMHSLVPVDSWQLKYLLKNRKVFRGIPVVFEWHRAASKETYEHFQLIEDVLSKY